MAPSPLHHNQVQAYIKQLYAAQSRRILATLIRLLGDFDRAEEALHDAFTIAMEQWPRDGLPQNPRAWLVSTGRFKAIDALRRNARFQASSEALVAALEQAEEPDWDEQLLADDYLRLVFTCCHPALSADAQIALTLREVCGLTTEEVARAFLSAPTTIAQRIVRAKQKIRAAGIPYEVPAAAQLPQRLRSVLRVIYLVYNEGYSASTGDSLTRQQLVGEAIRLTRLLQDLVDHPEVKGLLALMLLQHARRATRTETDGSLIVLEKQDRSRWDQALIAEGIALVRQALRAGPGPYAIQAAIAAVHAEAPDYAATDWHEIVCLYDLLLAWEPSPVVELNRAVAVAMRDGAAAGLQLVERLLQDKRLQDYHLAHAARADLYAKLQRFDEARLAYEQALALTQQAPEQRFLLARLAELPAAPK